MKIYFDTKKIVKKIHFLGIGGISMSAIAKQLYQNGYKISGSDSDLEGAKSLLSNCDIPLNKDNDLIECDAVVVSSAIKNDSAELLKANGNNKIITTRAQVLAEISKNYKTFIGVAGTHGKTTVTALIAHVLACDKLKFTAHIGGLDKSFGNYVNFGNDIFLSEVCEYKRNIKYLTPSIALLLNVDNDHIESYGSFSALKKEFKSYLARAKRAVCFDEIAFKNLKNAVYFSVKSPKQNYYITKKSCDNNNCEYIVYEHGEPLFEIDLKNFNPHDCLNVIATVAVCRLLNIGVKSIVSGIKSFNGVKRRNEVLYFDKTKSVIADYAHHPSQILNAVKNYRAKFGENCVFIFQPHTYSRTENLFCDFVSALSDCNNLYIYKTYGARESYKWQGSAKRLSNSLLKSVYLADEKMLKIAFNQLIQGDNTIIILGAGDLYYKILNFLKQVK